MDHAESASDEEDPVEGDDALKTAQLSAVFEEKFTQSFRNIHATLREIDATNICPCLDADNQAKLLLFIGSQARVLYPTGPVEELKEVNFVERSRSTWPTKAWQKKFWGLPRMLTLLTGADSGI